MAKESVMANFVISDQADIMAAHLNDGFIDIFDGLKPENTETEITNQRRCVSLRLGTPAFMPADRGVITANSISPGVAFADAEPATWARLYKSDHKTPVMDVTVGAKSGQFNIILPTARIVKGVTVTCTSFIHSVAKSTPGV
jgi:hypothetical protein